MQKLIKFYNLSCWEKKIFIKAIYLLAYYRLSLKFVPLRNIFYAVNKIQRSTDAKQPSPESACIIARLIIAASKIVPFSTCFSKALAGMEVLSIYGFNPQIHIGVTAPLLTKFKAHAWVTVEGLVIIGELSDLVVYKELPIMSFNTVV